VAGFFIFQKELKNMSPRAIRRAAERQSLKLAVNATKITLAQQAPTASLQRRSPETISDARLTANRANAQLSTGPASAEGKAKSSLNAVKTGLTGRTVLLPTDDALAYQQHLDRHFAEFSPATDKEKALVQTIADTEWRLLRIAPLEAGIYAVGQLELADQFPTLSNPTTREALILGKVFMTYRKDLSNLALQERRLRNQRKTDIAELQLLQQDRIQKRLDVIARAKMIASRCLDQKRDFDPAAHGFDFSVCEYQHFSERNQAQLPLTQTHLDFDTTVAAYRAAPKEAKAA
jgi:hypothetical protein